ncbi:hypothetical protein [Methylococcus sp. EFPC2]|uniref:hypothetical protein n=1 Tax=Methylococcus sp. EFPC2 TaxID=2812648 RepID=UPI001966EDA2|nr:hypothetical protein [Methylococcus sp. EFPC2]QSA96672.1 hypothetical protein JWZ97_15875 [Methylococcus sp. EFPC2]
MKLSYARVIVAMLTSLLLCGLGFPRIAGAAASGSRIWQKLQQNALLDAYFPDATREVAEPLVRASGGQWQGVQINGAYRSGWLNLYTVDADRLESDAVLADAGVDNFTRENLQGGALTQVDTGIVFLNTAAWKRLAAATYLTQYKIQPDLTAALAYVDAVGLAATRKYWDESTLSLDTPQNQRVGWLLRGAAAFVLAHEMGHMRIDDVASDPAPAKLPSNLTQRQKDERNACPEALLPEFRQRQQIERSADLAAVGLLGKQCSIGNDGQLRHAINMLGTSWYFLAAMSDKLLQMGRNSSSPTIARALRMKIGPELYERVVAARAAANPKGAVKSAYPSTHPPDTERMRAIETALQSTPCGGGNLDSSGAQMLEMFRLQMCRSLIGQGDEQ